jgi:Methylamine utilization protein MauJ
MPEHRHERSHVSVPAKPPEADEEKTVWHLKIPAQNEVFVGELAERGEWIVANIQTYGFWPVNAQKVMYRGHAFWIMPVTREYYPGVAMKLPPGKNRAECEELLMRFISNLSWVKKRGFMVEGISGGNLPRPMGRDKWSVGVSICDEFDLSYFPEPASYEALLALALMREGRGINHPAYAFLSFFKVLEVAFPDSKKRATWIDDNVASVKGTGVKEALESLAKNGITEIGAHLFDSGRCAVAHAKQQPIVDPDKIKGRNPYAALNDLTVKDVRQNGKLLLMRFESKEGDVIFRFALDFGNERLEFSVFDDIGVKDTGTAKSAERVAEIKRFERDYFGNGKLHIVNADTGALISRKDAYIPLNMFLNQQAADAEIARWKGLAQQRRERGSD